jgi:hypothetical protein
VHPWFLGAGGVERLLMDLRMCGFRVRQQNRDIFVLQNMTRPDA